MSKSTKARVAGLKRHRGSDDPATIEALREHRADTLAEYIRKVVDQPPPLSAEQRLKLAGLLVGDAR